MTSMAAETSAAGKSHSRNYGWLSNYGPLLLALYFVLTTRWGSYLLPGPPYIGDFALAILIGHRLWALARRTAPPPLIGLAVGIATGAMLTYAVVKLTTGELSTVALRDAAPYMYAVLIFFGQSSRDLQPRTVERLVYGTLILHLAWYTLSESSLAVRSSVETLGDSSVFLLQGRADIDGAFLGVLIALALHRTILRRTPLPSAAVGGWALTMVLLTESRASFLATVMALVLMAGRHAIVWRAWRREARAATASTPSAGILGWARVIWIPGLVAAMLVGVPLAVTSIHGTPAPLSRTIDAVSLVDGSTQLGPTIDPITGLPLDPVTGEVDVSKVPDPSVAAIAAIKAEKAAAKGGPGGKEPDAAEPDKPPQPVPAPAAGTSAGFGTAVARTQGWEAVLDWLPDGGVSRVTLGVGFGPHYLQQSGADVAFLGADADPTVRAVHNFALNTWARLGLVGLILEALILILALVAAVRLATRSIDPPPLDLFAGLLVVTIPVVAFFGVVLESPFGAIPFFWAVGYLSARMVEEGLWRPLPLPKRLGTGDATRSSGFPINRAHHPDQAAGSIARQSTESER